MSIRLGNRKEPIRLLARRHNYFPQRFLWRGEQYNIDAVERAWSEVRRNRKIARHFFRVRCAEGTFVLYQDARLNAWYLARRVRG
ncbi:MAG: DUF6504 family protein [Chloroflexota bacterium]|nr:DUF6504 family protein [Chloroflexota bacterium]